MNLPENFVYLNDIDATILEDIKYFYEANFIGRPIVGYEAPRCILTREAAIALANIQALLQLQSLALKVFDGYRPQMSVDDFKAWSQDPSDQRMKLAFYPNVDKCDFFKLGYLVEKSAHTRGSTVDLTIVHADGHEMLMGTQFDFMDERSHTLSVNVSAEARANRLFLKNLMEQAGFQAYDKEWWHFTLRDEPFPNSYFTFPVK
jgi:D-alanyl-D-alanine dipeptidase